MTLREAMLTLNGELDAKGQPTESGAEMRMERMRARLARLRKEREDAEACGYGQGILSMIDSDIWWQERAIEAAGG